jgi:NADH:ubiquinone oxidoreductase subunit D
MDMPNRSEWIRSLQTHHFRIRNHLIYFLLTDQEYFGNLSGSSRSCSKLVCDLRVFD